MPAEWEKAQASRRRSQMHDRSRGFDELADIGPKRWDFVPAFLGRVPARAWLRQRKQERPRLGTRRFLVEGPSLVLIAMGCAEHMPGRESHQLARRRQRGV